MRLAAPLLDISDEVAGYRDHGMLGFALDPNFATNGHFYVMYVVDRHHLDFFGTGSYNPATNDYFKPTIGRITRYTANLADDRRTADPASRLVLVGETKSTGFPVLHESHSIGTLFFGADGTLLATCGDGASYNAMDNGHQAGGAYGDAGVTDGIITAAENIGAFRVQLLDSHSGKMIRIDPATGNGVCQQSALPGGFAAFRTLADVGARAAQSVSLYQKARAPARRIRRTQIRACFSSATWAGIRARTCTFPMWADGISDGRFTRACSSRTSITRRGPRAWMQRITCVRSPNGATGRAARVNVGGHGLQHGRGGESGHGAELQRQLLDRRRRGTRARIFRRIIRAPIFTRSSATGGSRISRSARTTRCRRSATSPAARATSSS